MFEKLFDNPFFNADEKLKSELTKIESKNQLWFDSEENTLGKIENHYVLTFINQRFGFGFDDKSTLPESIRQECLEVASKVLA